MTKRFEELRKRNKIIYCIATIWLALGMVSTGIVQLIRIKERTIKLCFILRVAFLMAFPLFVLTGIVLADDVRSQNRITLQLENTTLHNVLEALEEQTDVTFSYSSSLRDMEPFSITAENELLDTVLSDLERQAAITFRRVGNMIAVTLQAANSQERASVNGYITDSRSGETLLAANIALREINRGTASNNSGYYTLTNIPPGRYTLVASYIGYQLYEREITLEAGENLRMNIELQPEGLQLQELIVESDAEREEQRNIGRTRMSTQLVRQLPAVIEPDVFRSVQLLPGVQSASDFSSALYIRGGSPDQTLILLDETTVYNPTHFFGLFSTFNPDAVKDVNLYKGSYPAEYGGRIGSVLSVYNKDGNRNQTRGTLSLGMLASRASVEGPYKYGSYMVAVRRSTMEPLLAALRKSEDFIPDTFYFYDLNGKLNIDLSENDRFSIAFYAGTDALAMSFLEDARIRLNYGNQTVSTQWRRIFSDRLFTSFTATGSRYFNQPEFEISGTPFENQNEIHDFSLKGDLEYIPNGRHSISAGFWAGAITLRLEEEFDKQVSLSTRIHSQYASAYLQEKWTPSNKWIFIGGLRLNAFSKGSYIRLDPRASLEYRPAQTIRFQAAYGRYHQFLTLITNEAFTGFDTWLTAADGVSPSYGDQFSVGAKTIPSDGYGMDIELYYRTMKDMFELNPFIGDIAGLDYGELFRFGEGYAWGAEVLFEKQTGRLRGFVGYTFGITRRKFPGFNAAVLDESGRGRFYPPKYDRTHNANIVGTYRLSQRWSVSAVFNFATGQAYTVPLGRTEFPNLLWGSTAREAFVVGNVNASRLPDNHRLDLSFSRTGTFFGMGAAEWQLQVINVYNRRNIWFYDYDFEENPFERTEIPMLPILPTVSYTINF